MKKLVIRAVIMAMVINVAIVASGFAQESIQGTLERLRSKYPNSDATAAVYLNEVAWIHRGEGIVLLGKTSGHNCDAPSGVKVSCDYLVDKNTKRGYDVIRGDDAGTPQFGGEGEDLTDALANGSRTLVDPVNPGSGPVDPPPAPTEPVQGLQGPKGDKGEKGDKGDSANVDLSPIYARLAALENAVIVLQSRPIPVSCKAGVPGVFSISCKLGF